MVQPKGDHWQEDLFFPFRHIYLRAKHTLMLTPPMPKKMLPPMVVIPEDMRDFYTKPRHGHEDDEETLQRRINFRFYHYKQSKA